MSLYLKYRPLDFEDLVGQDFIKNTLKKALAEEKTVGAYLFCGSRGTGKTSTARIFAKAVNCESPTDGNPCLKCSTCSEFATESLVDIVEIDAASYTGVDNIREIIEKSQFRPSKTKFKIYIIDEVHMLSKGAFNALLKILEEPPEYVKFILATTETHKVPETIISRCQRYDFKRGTKDDLEKRLRHIAKHEGTKVDDESLNYIIRSSSGGYRNAISLFEQLTNDGEINFKSLVEKLGVVEQDVLENFCGKLLVKDVSIISDYEELVNSSKNIKLFFKELIFYVKDKSVKLLFEDKDISQLILLLEALNDTYDKTKNTHDENTTFLIGLLKIVKGGDLRNLEQVEAKQKVVPKKSEKKEVKKSQQIVEEKPPLPVEQEGVGVADIGDIFPSEDVAPTPRKTESNNSSFDKETLIKSLKEVGAKGGLTMSIRGAELSLNENVLEIKFKTNFALKSTNTSDNLNLISQGLNKMDIHDAKILLRQ